AIDQFSVVIRRYQDDGHRSVLGTLAGRFDAVEFWHLDVGDYQIGMAGSTLLDQLLAVLGDRDYFVPEEGQDFLQIVAHVGFVVCDGDPQGLLHSSPLGTVMTISAPPSGASPTAMRPPPASTIRLTMAMPRPVPLVLVVK